MPQDKSGPLVAKGREGKVGHVEGKKQKQKLYVTLQLSRQPAPNPKHTPRASSMQQL